MDQIEKELAEQLKFLGSSRAVFEMAIDSGDVIERAKSLSETFSDHLMKCLLFKGEEPYNKWLNEIMGYINRVCISKVRYNGKIRQSISLEDLHEYLFDPYMPEGYLQGRYEYAVLTNPQYKPIVSLDELGLEFWERYHRFEIEIYKHYAIEKRGDKEFLDYQIDSLRGPYGISR